MLLDTRPMRDKEQSQVQGTFKKHIVLYVCYIVQDILENSHLVCVFSNRPCLSCPPQDVRFDAVTRHVRQLKKNRIRFVTHKPIACLSKANQQHGGEDV